MGLLRIATFAAVAVALLPSDREQQQRLYERAGATAEWVITFCDRNAYTCTKGSELWSQFLAKAEFGAKLAYDLMREHEGSNLATSSLKVEESKGKVAPALLERESGTLTPLDKEPDWRGKHHDKNGI
ncbi:DUF5330 domain-containing protein [Hyphomicrobium sp.]|uniref:DUF5330 domain-containing protein n=1 Tax=Hyphomicrobium sp. TaxID=82 RepID=UPI002D76EA7A|nr:DUF5330 domain-containing protein [Hyphomicrobium sp.]HET6390770.1 DUF5330 domain-containing protein [Hyphomicrobium sp.]